MVVGVLARAHTIYLCDFGRHVFCVCTHDAPQGLEEGASARACVGKVGAGTVEAEENTCMGRWICVRCCAGRQPRVDRQTHRQTGKREYPMGFVLSSALG